MRIDKFLKVSRIIKRRSVAKAVCDQGRILVNHQPAKAGKELQEGDILSINLGSKILTYQVLSTPEGNIPTAKASSLYKLLSEEDTKLDT